MMDAIGALQWVKRNISAFGGDPNNVTIFGESAGAIMIGALVGSPQAKGLFHRAIVESGAWMGLQMARMTTAEQAQGNGAKAHGRRAASRRSPSSGRSRSPSCRSSAAPDW